MDDEAARLLHVKAMRHGADRRGRKPQFLAIQRHLHESTAIHIGDGMPDGGLNDFAARRWRCGLCATLRPSVMNVAPEPIEQRSRHAVVSVFATPKRAN